MGDKNVCKFWLPQKRSGCKFGDRCRFEHPLPKPSKCKYFSSGRGCRDGDRCLYTHDDGGGHHGGKGGHGKGGHGGHKSHGKGSPMPEAMKKQIMDIFKQFDYNHDGSVERDELSQVFQLLSPTWEDSATDTLLKAMDTNRDGRIQIEEFLEFCNNSGDRWDPQRKLLRDMEVGGAIRVCVSDMAGKDYHLEAKTSWTVARLKLALYHLTGIAPPSQLLAAGGEDVDNLDTLGGARIRDLVSGRYEFQLVDMSGDAGAAVAVEAPARATEKKYVWTEEATKDDMPPDFQAALGVIVAGAAVTAEQIKFLQSHGWPADHLVASGLLSVAPAAEEGAGEVKVTTATAGEVQLLWTEEATKGMPPDFEEGLGKITLGMVATPDQLKFLESKGWPADHLVDAGLLSKSTVTEVKAADAPGATAGDATAAKAGEVQLLWTEEATKGMPPDLEAGLGKITLGMVATPDQLKFLESKGWPADHLVDAGLLSKSTVTEVKAADAPASTGGVAASDDFDLDLPLDSKATGAADDDKKEEEFEMDLF
eukprot:TRINITY_DN5865_c0_g1_i1.p1 TRINITY_DN5865_c0_g1~~TRINITY_DN5865_c0_g1_i1.p1  ORF type:complete len:537 (-),score=126.33 TRINITY_DN5865_c0_g1_i1:85-1695(-)